MNKILAVAALLAAFAVNTTQAGVIAAGTQGVADTGGPTASNSDITVAGTTFTIGDIVLSGNGTGDFALNPISGGGNRDLGGSTLDMANPGALTFGSPAFGTFTATSISLLSSTSGQNAQVTFFAIGNYTPGSVLVAAGYNGAAQAASFTISFTQTGGPGAAVSDSATFSTPPTGVPEPATVVGLISGVVAFGAFRLRRKAA